MPLPTGYTVAIAQTVLALALAPGVVGLIRWIKARLQNRRGAPVWQPYLELRKLLGKEVVVSEHASWVFHAAPFVVFASTVAVTFLVPVLAVPLPLAATGRLPVDNPATHLELTMIHEAMVLEYSGRYLALIEWAAALKLVVFFTLLGNLFVPWGVATALTPAALALAVATLLVKLVALAAAVAV